MAVVAVLLAGLALVVADAPQPARAAGTFVNPVSPRPDPFVVFHRGRYYTVENDTSETRLLIRSAATVAGLSAATPQLVWADGNTSRNKQVWAPSLLNLNDRWYLYYTASDGVDNNHRNYVLESTGLVSQGATPAGPYAFKARIFDPAADSWAIDGLPFTHNGALYYAYAGALGNQHNEMFIARMANPYSLSGARTHLPLAGGCPTIREAPATLNRNGRTWLVYSTCDTGTPDYQLWMTSIADGADPLVATNWRQRSGAVYQRNDAAGVFAPGSNNFFRSPDGTEDWMAYHAKTTSAFTYDGRTTRLQKIGWNTDGSPDLGRPIALGTAQATPSGDPGPSAPAAGTRIAGPGGKCVDVAGDDTGANLSPVQLWDCLGAAADQLWTWNGTSLRTLGRCLDVAGNITAAGTRLQLWDCNGAGGQQWVQQANGSMLNPQSGRCLDSPSGATANGTRLQIWDCNGSPAQVFRKQ
ncbi:glycoside hydrolase family 43 protein [Actinoplanes friuliensis]|uniref:Alpha-N-arabinofuranosidase n=1 Tax=Actinoplanes friuliensis DSM 7358 TaxID=1246995 RepID=U5VV25_9ACTN|nr:glycoside hydrolase family 43 protein [Actinoplanes friuliensis]AGZ40853.1 alpha-N-arabinofuranosidase [Actinoplanes friuliensis DSM 7358]